MMFILGHNQVQNRPKNWGQMQTQGLTRASSRYVEGVEGMKSKPTHKKNCEHKRESIPWFTTCTFVTQN